MNVNPKSLRRVMVLIIGAGLIVAILAGVYYVRQRQIAARYVGYRAAGMAAFAAEDYAATLKHLKRYIGKHEDDRDALFAYATSRSRIEEPDGEHLAEGIKAFQVLSELEPDSQRMRDALLEQYTLAHYNTEAIELADKVLATNADDVTALRAKAIALERLRQFPEAVAVAERLNAAAPTNLDDQLITYRLYQRTGKPAREILARAEAMRERHPKDPRFELLLAIAYGQSGDADRARELLRAAAERNPPDPQFVRQLSMVLDRNQMFDQSQALLERAAAQTRDPELLAILVQRLCQNGYAREAAERLEDVDPASPESDSQLLALRAVALFSLNRGDEARTMVAALGERTGDGTAMAWATALATRFAEPQPEPGTAVAQYRAALERDPDNGVIRYMLGEAYERLGEAEPAMAAWRRAAELVPSWSKPAEKLARALAATGRTRQALEQALLARRGAPHELSTAITYAGVAFQHLDKSSEPAKLDELLKLVEAIQKASPGEPETLPIHITLLARSGQRDAAINAARAAINLEDPAPAAATLLRLASVSRSERLELESDIAAAVDKSEEPITPALALARATELAAAGDPAAGLQLLEEHAAKNGAGRPAHWQLALAQFREQTDDLKAEETWSVIGEAYPQDITVQAAILRQAASVRGNRPFIARTIDRVKALTGEEGTLWRIERARWLLGSDLEKDHSDAIGRIGQLVRLYPTLVEPRLLLAAAMEKVDNMSGAIKELRVAAELDPDSTGIATELARLLQAQGRFHDARVYLERAAQSDSLDPVTRCQLAAMFARQNAPKRGIELLREAARQGSLDPAGELLLAKLHRRLGQPDDAEAIYQKLLARPERDVDAIGSAADFYAAQGRPEQAQAVLKKLDTGSAPAGMRELVLARFAERHGSAEAAAAHYAAATQAAPSDPAAWRQRIAQLMRAGRAGEAVAVADDALKALPDNKPLQLLKGYAAVTADAARGPRDLQPLIADLSEDPANARSLATAQLLQEEWTGRLTAQEAAARFRQLADRFPRHRPLQVEAVRRYLALGNLREASEVVTRAMYAFPDDPDAARLATDVFRAAREWKQMESAAQQWRSRSLERPIDADLAIAEARLAGGDAKGALSQLESHLDAVPAGDGNEYAALLIIYGRALAAAGRAAEARARLEPLLPESPQWRAAWMDIAVENVTDAPEAIAWLDHVTPLIPTGADPSDERLALARAWHALGLRWREVRAHKAACRLLAPLSQRADADPETFLLLASACQALDDPSAAERYYRRFLSLRPNSAAALNNLAYLLLTHGGDAAEAEALASRAVALSPNVSSFHDTLGRARGRVGSGSDALQAFERALELEPESVEAMIGKVTVLSALGERAQVRELLQQINVALPRNPHLSPEVKRELEQARSHANAGPDPR